MAKKKTKKKATTAKTRTPWSKEEIKKLKKIFKNQSTKDAAKELGRSFASVQAKASELNLSKTKKYLRSIGRKV